MQSVYPITQRVVGTSVDCRTRCCMGLALCVMASVLHGCCPNLPSHPLLPSLPILLPPPVVLALIWGVLAAATCFIMPIWESRKHIMDILSHVMTCTPSSTQGEAFVGAPKGVDAAAVVDGAAAKAAPPMSS